MKIEELKRSIRKVAALIDVHEEIRNKGEGREVELKIAREQIISALVEAKKALVAMERETKNV